MLGQRDISLDCLLTYVGFIVGIGLLILSEILDIADLSRWGLAALVVACAYALHRSMKTREALLWRAFAAGQEHERNRELTAVR